MSRCFVARAAWVTPALLATLALPAAAEDVGVRAGDLVIHPNASVGFGYDDNVFYDSEEDPDGPISATVLRVGAGVGIENRHPNKLSLRFDSGLLFRHFPTSSAEDGSPEAKATEARSGIERGDAELTIGILPRSTVTLEPTARFIYTDRPRTEESELGFERIDTAFGADLRFRPGDDPDARAFELRLGYRYRMVLFDEAEEVGLERAEKQAHEMRFLSSWKFLPKTAVLADFRLNVNDYEQPAGDVDRDSSPFRGLVGLQGLISQRFSLILKAGYANTFNEVGESYSGFIGNVEATYALEPVLRTSLGLERDARDTSFSNFVTVHRVYGRLEVHFLERWAVGGGLAFEHYDYSESGVGLADGVTGVDVKRDDPVLRGDAYIGLNARQWLELRLSLNVENNMTDFRPPVGTADGGFAQSEIPADYSRTLVLVSAEAAY